MQKLGRLLLLLGVCGGMTGASLAQASDRASAALAKLRALAGEWEGTFAWSGGSTASGKMDARYYTTGNGSAIVEDLLMGGEPSMTTVYHLDGADLRATHFCAAQNQPRLRAKAFDPDSGQITFSFVDVTNLRTPTAGHVEGLDVRFLDADHITLRFLFKGDGKESFELVDLRRKK